MHQAGRDRVGQLNDGIRDPTPCRRAVLIIGGSELVGAHHAFRKRVVAIAIEHELCRSPDVDLGYHATKVYGRRR